MKRIASFLGMVTMAAAQTAAPDSNRVQDQINRAMDAANAAISQVNPQIDPQIQEQVNRAVEQAQRAVDQLRLDDLDLSGIKAGIKEGIKDGIKGGIKGGLDVPMLDDLQFRLDGLLALGPQDAAERAQEARERAQEARERARDAKERARDYEERINELYRDGISAVDDHRYERAIECFNNVILNKSPRSDGAYYWKAYTLNKVGKREEALAALAEIPKQFPQSRWASDANALKLEIQQASGSPVSPDSVSDDDLKLLAIVSLMNSDPERAVPLLEKVLNDSKNNLGLRLRALFVLAQSRSDKARDIVLRYAKGGSNPDLQLRAVSYLGTFRSKDSQQALADVYAANADVAVRRAVLRSMATSRDAAHLFNAAKTESNADLRREAIRSLGTMQAANELGQLYATETDRELKDTILSSLLASRASDKLVEIAKSEKNAELRGEAIRYLGAMRNEKTADALTALYAGESDKNVKEQIIRSLGSQGAGKQLVEITRNEKDLELKKEGVQSLGRMRNSKEATDYLMELVGK